MSTESVCPNVSVRPGMTGWSHHEPHHSCSGVMRDGERGTMKAPHFSH